MKVLVVLDHPRRNSFCGAIADAFAQGLTQAGHSFEIADLRGEGFDPRMPEADEPDWEDASKVYSPEVLAEQARVARHDAIAFVFPIWWWSVPATTKGWIDRVWNRGWAYGPRKLGLRKGLMIGLGASGPDQFAKRGYDQAMQTQLVTGILNYCGIEDGALELLLETTAPDDQIRTALLERARELGRNF